MILSLFLILDGQMYWNSVIICHDIPYKAAFQLQEESRPAEPRNTVPLDLRLLNAAQQNERREVVALLSANPKLNVSEIRNQKLFTLLHFATYNNQYETIVAIIDHYEAYLMDRENDPDDLIKQYVNLQTSDGFSAIHFAAYRGNIVLMEYLYERGANIQQTNEHGMNIMHIAAQGDQPVSVVFANSKGKQILDIIGISVGSIDFKGGSPLHWSCFYGCEQSTIYLLSLLPENPPYHPLNILDQQQLSPLHLAVMSGNSRLVKKLLLAGADKDLKGKEKKTPSEMALENEYHNIYAMLTKEENSCIRYYNIKPGFKRKRKSYRELIRFLSIFLYQVGTFVVFVVPLDDSLLQNQVILICLALTVLVMIFFLLLACLDSGTMKREQTPLLKLLKTYECYEVCPFCSVVKLPRSKHCDVCQRCVMVYDHHCPWINNCIGTRNHGIFVTFILFLLGGIILMNYLVIRELIVQEYEPPFLKDYLSNLPFEAIRYSSLVIHLIIGILFSLALMTLFYTQMVNLCSGKTTLERFAIRANPSSTSSMQLKTTSQPSVKASLLGNHNQNQRFHPKLQYSFKNCFQMCCLNRIQYRKKEQSLAAI